MSLKVHTSNITNKNDPKSLSSWVVIGNLNRAMVKKADIRDHLLQVWPSSCSVHMDYAIVQYASERHARAAVLGESGRVLAGPTLDINMAGEPKPNGLEGLERAASASSGPPISSPQGGSCEAATGHHPSCPSPQTLSDSLPAPLLTSSSSSRLTLKCSELQTIKAELTQIKYNTEALLGRLDQILEEQSPGTDGKKKNDSKKSETTQEAETPLGELLPGDDGDEALAQADSEDLDNSQYTELDELTLQ